MLLKKRKCFTFLSQSATFFSKQLSYLRPIFVNLSTEKHLYCQLIVAFEKKNLKIKAEKRRNHWRQKKSRISEDFLDLSTENRKFRRYCMFQWNESKEFSKQISFIKSKVDPLRRNIKDRQRICFLFVDWANGKFFLFVEEMCRVSFFFLALKRTLLIVLLQVS